MEHPIKEKWKKASKTASQAISTTFFQEFQEWRWRELNPRPKTNSNKLLRVQPTF